MENTGAARMRRHEMPRVRIITDSVAGIPGDLVEEYGIKVIPAATIRYNGTSYIEGVTLSISEAYRLIEKDPDGFGTSALSPGYILDEYRQLAATAQSILHITLSSELSAGYQAATLAAEMLTKESPQVKMRVLDSRTVAGAQGLIVLEAARAAAKGKGLDEVARVAERVRQETRGIMMLDTLRYVYRSGRMSKLSSRIASMLSIRPINRMTDKGTLEYVDRVRSRERGYKRMIEMIKEEAPPQPLKFMVMHAAAPEMANRFCYLLQQHFDCGGVLISEYSPVMGYGAGPGALFVGFRPRSSEQQETT
jgi:DegV family protein with EDD domain